MAQQAPPGRLGAYANLGEEGYASVVKTGDVDQLSVYIHRAIAFHGGIVNDVDALNAYATSLCGAPGTYADLLATVREQSCAWTSWPGLEQVPTRGLKRTISTHSEPMSPSDAATAPSAPPMEGNESSSSGVPAPQSEQALRGTAASNFIFPEADCGGGYSAGAKDPQATCSSCSSSSCAASAPSADESQAMNSTQVQEVLLNDSELCSAPFAEFGPLLVAAPPWRPTNIFSRRLFSVVLRNPRNPERGLVLISSTSQSTVTQAAEGIVAELGDSVAALSDPSLYDALRYDPALLAAVASSESGGGLQNLRRLTGSLSTDVASAAVAAASTSSSMSAAGTAQESHPTEDHGECPICFEEISPGDAAMRCSGSGGVHHYFHAHCLQEWIRQSRSGSRATCPICRGALQFNGERLETFLQGPEATNLNAEERSFLQSISDGLQHKNSWSDMSTLEKGAFSVGIAAAAGWGFMLGYNGDCASNHMNNHVVTPMLSNDHQIAQGVGWVAGLLARIIRDATKDRGRDSRRRS